MTRPPMTRLERSIIVAVAIVSMVWAGGLLVAYLLQSDEAPVAIKSASTPGTPNASPTAMASLPKIGSLNTSLASGVPTPDEKLKNITKFWSQSGGQNAMNRPHGRWEDRTGLILPPPPDLAGADASLSATLISLHLDGIPLRTALTELGKQAGAKFTLFPQFVWQQSTFPPITMNVDQMPLIEVINELCCKAGLAGGGRMSRWGGGGPAAADPAVPVMPLEVQIVDHAMGPWVVSGPFAFEIDQVNHLIPLGNAVAPIDGLPSGAVTITLAAQHEPKLILLGVQQAVPTEATDENGVSLLLPVAPIVNASHAVATPTTIATARSLVASLFGRKPAVRRRVGPWRPAGLEMQIGLNHPAGAGKWIELLRFAPKFLVQARGETIEILIKSPMSPLQQTVAGLQIDIASMRLQNPQFCSGNIIFTRQQQTDEQWEQIQVALQSVKPILLDASGKALPQPQANFQQQTERTMTMGYQWFQQQYAQEFVPLVPAKMVLTLPSELRVVNVPVEFKHLPLP